MKELSKILETAINLLRDGRGFTGARMRIQKEFNLDRTDAMSIVEIALNQIEDEGQNMKTETYATEIEIKEATERQDSIWLSFGPGKDQKNTYR